MTGTVIAQVISLVSLVFLQRFYFGPEEFANLDLFYWFVAIFSSVSALRIETGIILEPEKPVATFLTFLSLKLTFIVSVISFFAFILYAKFDTSIQQLASNNFIIALVPVSVFLLGSLQVFIAWFTREKLFGLISTNKVVQNTSTASSQLFLGALELKSFGLIYGRTIGLIISNIMLFIYFLKGKNKSNETMHLSSRTLITKHQKFILYTTPSVIIGGIINFLLIDLFIQYYGKTFGGEISVAYRYLGISLAIVSTSFSQVYYSNIATISSKTVLKKTYSFWLKRLSVISTILIVLVQLTPNSLVVFILGENWEGLLTVTKIMVIWMAVMFVSSSLSYIYIKVGRQKEMLFFDLFHLVLIYFSIKIPFENAENALITLIWFTAAQCFYYLIAVLAAYYFIDRFEDSKDN